MGEAAKMKRIQGTDRLIMTAAFRYALGRQSYMVDHVASWMEKNAGAITKADRERYIREIDEQSEQGLLGMAMDDRRWRRVQSVLRSYRDRLPPAKATEERDGE